MIVPGLLCRTRKSYVYCIYEFDTFDGILCWKDNKTLYTTIYVFKKGECKMSENIGIFTNSLTPNLALMLGPMNKFYIEDVDALITV